MGTKYRKDLTTEDLRIVTRFKHHLHRLAYNGRIKLDELTAPIVYEQNWYLSGGGWKHNMYKERKNHQCYVLTMRDFRVAAHGVALDIDTVTEGLVIEALKRFSLILFGDKEGLWKWERDDGSSVILLEHKRLSQSVTIKKRNTDTAEAKLDEYNANIKRSMTNFNWSFEKASDVESGSNPVGYLQELEQQVKTKRAEKERIRAEIDTRIGQRLKEGRH